MSLVLIFAAAAACLLTPSCKDAVTNSVKQVSNKETSTGKQTSDLKPSNSGPLSTDQPKPGEVEKDKDPEEEPIEKVGRPHVVGRPNPRPDPIQVTVEPPTNEPAEDSPRRPDVVGRLPKNPVPSPPAPKPITIETPSTIVVTTTKRPRRTTRKPKPRAVPVTEPPADDEILFRRRRALLDSTIPKTVSLKRGLHVYDPTGLLFDPTTSTRKPPPPVSDD